MLDEAVSIERNDRGAFVALNGGAGSKYPGISSSQRVPD